MCGVAERRSAMGNEAGKPNVRSEVAAAMTMSIQASTEALLRKQVQRSEMQRTLSPQRQRSLPTGTGSGTRHGKGKSR